MDGHSVGMAVKYVEFLSALMGTSLASASRSRAYSEGASDSEVCHESLAVAPSPPQSPRGFDAFEVRRAPDAAHVDDLNAQLKKQMVRGQ
mmetsp:Transcript_38512/g.71674  ORF Transcript_38512/g.71674 Transcript_38512/m.71674 type:complete len:90 (-) Transcript_38512:183-452(-)